MYCYFCANRSRVRWIQHMYDFHRDELNLILEEIRVLNKAVAQIDNSDDDDDDEIIVVSSLNNKSLLIFFL